MANQKFDQDLFDMLNSFRNMIFKPKFYYNNNALRKFATLKPLTKEEILAIDSDTKKFEKFGNEFIRIIKLHNAKLDEDTAIEIDDDIRALWRVMNFEERLYEVIIYKLRIHYQKEWWLKGIPKDQRMKAAAEHESSGGKIPKEYGFYLIDLKEIIIKNWPIFMDVFDPNNKGKKEFEHWFNRWNDIRNRMSHRLRSIHDPLSSDDHRFIKERYYWIDEIFKNNVKKELGEELGNI